MGFKAISLIKGDADMYIHPSTTRRWDVCAPQAVLESVGGRLTGLDGSPLGFTSKSSPGIPSEIGLFATADRVLYDRWNAKISDFFKTSS
ncbi:hypothetical protein Smp_019610 [Schistosoma mansoni]|uniref:hypothetical protein n=1 Tax=Schistosoma mansoni TaxID=6183 RepID=UPI0001A645F2|nr:hypothetical protein Smp_019610 [Schistosoma mansoni]|eukprot:XP_018654695.1 hypothetical protein Smp_019610 [Schistosoma mansoni]